MPGGFVGPAAALGVRGERGGVGALRAEHGEEAGVGAEVRAVLADVGIGAGSLGLKFRGYAAVAGLLRGRDRLGGLGSRESGDGRYPGPAERGEHVDDRDVALGVGTRARSRGGC